MGTIKTLLASGAEQQLEDQITIRTELQSADLGYIIYQHALLYKQEYNYGLDFEAYVAAGVYEFYKQYDSATNRI